MKRPIVWVTIFTICGIYMRLGISEMMCLVSFFFVLLSISWFVIKYRKWNYLLLFFFAILGFILAEHQMQKIPKELPLNGTVEGTGVVEEVGVSAAGNQKLYLHGTLQDAEGRELREVEIYTIWTGEDVFAVGDCVGFQGELALLAGQTYPGGYDEGLYLETKGFSYKLYPEQMWKTGKAVSFSSKMAEGRAKVHTVLDEMLPMEESGILKAMLTGDRSDLPKESYELYTRAGVVHVLCISGLHMSCLALYVSVFMEKILKCSKRSSAVVTMLVALGFLAFTGATPSAVRAVTMICVVMTGRVLFRLHDRRNEIAIAAFLILLIQPLYLFHIGFQLSFITVIGLCLAAERMEQKRKKDRTPLDWVKESIFFSFYASLWSYPLVAYHFYAISTVGILANLVILPLSGLLLGFGILSAVLGLFYLPAGIFAAGSAYVILQIYEITCTVLLKLPFSYLLVGQPTQLTVLLCYGLLLFYLKWGERKGSWKAAMVFCVALLCTVFENTWFRKENTVAFLDVGQGDAAVISTYDEKTYLVDGGGQYGKALGENTGATVLLPYLEYLGVSKLDGIFLSHPDTDHMTGILEVLEEIPTEGLYFSAYPFAETEELILLKETVAQKRVPLYTIKAGDGSADGAWECLYPFAETAFLDGDDNHGSAVLRYTYGGTTVLFTGDIANTDEAILLGEKSNLSADVLKVSHHGSNHSSSEAFLTVVDAEEAVISCGENNIYRHPHADTLMRLEEADTKVYRTDLEGSILLTIASDGTYEIETMTERKPFYENIKEKLEKW